MKRHAGSVRKDESTLAKDRGLVHIAEARERVQEARRRKEMNRIDHAKRELELAGNDDAFNQSILNAIEAFFEFGHSGGSAPVAIEILTRLLEYKNITPLTSDPKEWQKIDENIADNLWQSQRRADAFSKDGGRTYHLVDNPKEVFETVRMWEGNNG